MPISDETRESIKRSSEIAMNLFDIMHSIKDNGLDKGIEEYKKSREVNPKPDLDEEDF